MVGSGRGTRADVDARKIISNFAFKFAIGGAVG